MRRSARRLLEGFSTCEGRQGKRCHQITICVHDFFCPVYVPSEYVLFAYMS